MKKKKKKKKKIYQSIINDLAIINRQRTFYKKIKDQTYFIGNLDQLIDQCFFRRFATIDFGYLYYGEWNMFISFCSTGYQAKPKDLLMADLYNLKSRNDSSSSISDFFSHPSHAVLSNYNNISNDKRRNSSLFSYNNKRSSSIDVLLNINKKKTVGGRELKRSFSDDNVNNSFQIDEKKSVSLYILIKIFINGNYIIY